jgi:hypothetical protein
MRTLIERENRTITTSDDRVNVMAMFRNIFRRIPVGLIFALAAMWLFYTKPWETEVWITTTPDAFVGPAIGPDLAEIVPGKIGVGITPAPWPEEAREILRAAEHGRVVHVTLVTNDSTYKFDISGISPAGNLLVDIRSMSDAKLVTNLLRFGSKKQ